MPPSARSPRDRLRTAVGGLGITRAEAAALLLLALAALAGLALVWWLQGAGARGAWGDADEGGGPPAGAASQGGAGAAIADAVEGQGPGEDELVVHVAGLVAEPGLQRLPPGTRVADALLAAGGTLPDAWLEGLNLARPLTDGEQIVVPPAPSHDATRPAAAPAGSAGEGGAAPSSGIRPDGRVDLNRATAAELETLPGVGPVMAGRIVEHREQHGPFASVGDLRQIHGVGEKTFQRLADLVDV